MEEQKENNLPIEVKSKAMLANYPVIGKTVDSLRRATAILGSTTTMLLGLGITVAPIPGAAIAGYTMFGAGLTRFTQNVTLKTEPTLLFGSKKQGDEIGIYQDLFNFGTSSRMAGYEALEKMSMMGLQTLVGFSRYKQNLKDTPFEVDENGQKIYSQKFATLTHGINLENFKALEALGYIKIDSMTSQFEPKSLDEKIAALTQKKGEPKRSYLLMEKIGFGNWSGARDAVKAMLFGDKKEKENNSREMQKVSFRLTDKPIDFEEIKKFRSPQYRKSLPSEMVRAAAKIGMMARLMDSRKLSIEKDAFGRDYIKYPSRIENARINKRREESKRETEERRKSDSAKSKIDQERKRFEKEVTEGVETNGQIIENPDISKGAPQLDLQNDAPEQDI